MGECMKARRAMVHSQIETSGVNDTALLSLFSVVPREIFVPEDRRFACYRDVPVDLGGGRVLMPASMCARLLNAAAPERGDVALNLACGTGYDAAILSGLVETVIAQDENPDFSDAAGQIWEDLGCCNIVSVQGGLRSGAPKHAPFSLIFVGGGAVPQVPEIWKKQLSIGGRLVAVEHKTPQHPLGEAVLYRKIAENICSRDVLFEAALPDLPEMHSVPAFVLT